MDLEKAFDKVNWQKSFQTLQKIGVGFKNRQLIHNIYKNHSTEIRIEDKSATAEIQKDI